MMWNWQQKNWPEFDYSASKLEAVEERFLIESAKLIGATSIITEEQKQRFTIDLMSEEALKSSKIEGEFLNRDSVASSILRQLGLAPEYSDHHANDKEKGIAALMSDNYRTFDQPLTDEMMFRWHACVVAGSWNIRDVGKYRTGREPMQVVSGYEGNYKVHFEAPPATSVPAEMDAFVQWFNDTGPNGTRPLPALTRAGIAHIYFVAIHPFEDGNGRIGRALSEKALAQSLGRPALVALSHEIEKSRQEYYSQLEKNQKGLSIDGWLSYFTGTALHAAAHSQKLVRFIVEKARLFDRVKGQINQRQEKALLRMFAEGMDGFKGGLSADKYIKMTNAARATATRDLQKLLELNALTKTGALRHTRYWLNLGEEFETEKRKYLSEQSESSK
ncbi:MAG: Fic family protein [Mariprofundaceae bacterium]|nr:Fic family protein [Mariprofundaceae bacterium]